MDKEMSRFTKFSIRSGGSRVETLNTTNTNSICAKLRTKNDNLVCTKSGASNTGSKYRFNLNDGVLPRCAASGAEVEMPTCVTPDASKIVPIHDEALNDDELS